MQDSLARRNSDQSSVTAMLAVMLIGVVVMVVGSGWLTNRDSQQAAIALKDQEIQKLQSENAQLKAQIQGMKDALAYRK
jgi:cell division protein FtsB